MTDGRWIRRGAALTAGGVVAAALVAAPAAAAQDRTLVTASTGYDSASAKEALAQCPRGTRVLGGGGHIEGGDRQVHLIRLQALGSSDRFAAGAEAYLDYTGVWRVTSYAICGPAPRGLEYRSYSTPRTAEAYKEAEAHCSPGKRLISAGGRVYGGDGQVALVRFFPAPALVLAAGAATPESGGGEWQLWSHAVCADPLPGLSIHHYSTSGDSEDKILDSACPPGQRLLGLGGDLQADTGFLLTPIMGRAFYAGAYPSADLTTATTDAREYPGGTTDDWSSTVSAVCAD